MPTEIKVPVVDAVNISIYNCPNSPCVSCPGVAGEDKTATAREEGQIKRTAAASKKRDTHDEPTREGPGDRGRAAPTKRRRRERFGETEHPDPPALGIYAMRTKKDAGKWRVQFSYLGRVVTLWPFNMEQALLVNRVLRGELEGKRSPELSAEEIESNIKLAKEAALRALPVFKDSDNVDELVSTYSKVAKASEPPCDGKAPAKCPMNLRAHTPQSRPEEERAPETPPGLFGIGIPGKREIRLGYGGRQLALQPLTKEQTSLANRVLRKKLELSSKRSKANDGSAKRKAAPKRGSPAAKRVSWAKGKPGPKRVSSASYASRKSAASAAFGVPEVSAEKAAVASKARHSLQEAVPSLPHAVSETHTVRCFGRIKPEWHSVASPLDALYSSPHAIYPVGFSYDRLDFSPVHGRAIKLRCDILDGGALRERREEEEEKKEKERARLKLEEGGEPKLVDETTTGARNGAGDAEDLGDGPVFRVTWGEGVEEEGSDLPCPFDPYVASAHFGCDADVIAAPLSSKKGKPAGLPEVGMRVSVRFDKAKMYSGVIVDVQPVHMKMKNKKVTCNITIQYDGGASEVSAFPDPDINVAYQGYPPVEMPTGLVTDMNGKPVRSVLAKTPLEAWGKTLLSLGLIDEIMFEAALQELQLAREEGFETKDKLNATNKKRIGDRGKEKMRRSNRQSVDGDDQTILATDGDGSSNADKMVNGDVHKTTPPAEVALCIRFFEMRKKLENARQRSKAAAMSLANSRIANISPFAANPFHLRDTTAEATWLSSAIEKDRAKMGNAGNKRKIVNPATMLDRSDTFLVPKIENLVEGLPGTEFAPSYIFRTNRSTTSASNQGSQAWIQEAKLRHQQEQQEKAQEKKAKAQEKQTKAQERQVKVQTRQEKAVGVSATAPGKWRVEVKYYNENIYVGTHSVWEHAVLVNRVVREGLKESRYSKLSKDEIRSNQKLAMEAAMEALSDFKDGAADRVEALIARVQRESVKNQSCTNGERSDSDMPAYERIPGIVDRRPGKWQEEGADAKDFVSKVESRQKNSIVEQSPARRRADDSCQIKDSKKNHPLLA